MADIDYDTFSKMGKTYQEKVVQAVLQDYLFAEQMADVLNPRFFELKYLQEVCSAFYSHKQKFKTYPSHDILEIMITRNQDIDELLAMQVREYLSRIKDNPLNGDAGFIQSSSLDFCKRQTLKEAMIKAIEKMEENDYDSISSIIKDALNRGASRDLGHDYIEGFAARGEKSARSPMTTGWPIIDKELNGGWERGILATFIAPTGAGKSMFLCNVGAAGIANGFNVLYVTCEMADFKIGLRFDSYFSGVAINDVANDAVKIEADVRGKVKGRLFIKEFPTKQASVQTVRSYIQRLTATKDFAPDIVLIDYADLLRGSKGYGDKRFELEGVYEELRCLAQELNCVMITADQTNRAGLDMEVVSISQIGESYAKATVCDVIFTISRRAEDKQSNCGRLFIAKSRLGRDGVVFPFLLNSATVKVSILEQGVDPVALFMDQNKNLAEIMSERFNKLSTKR